MIEVEWKFELSLKSWPWLLERVATLHPTRPIENSDSYYDTETLDLLRQAVFVRVRNHQQLEFKFNEQAATAHTQSTERIFSLVPEQQHAKEMNRLFSRFLPQWRSAETVEEALHNNRLVKLAHIEKQRVQYVDDDLVVCVDHVKGLGDFLEIEVQCEEGSDTSQTEAKIQRFVSGLEARQVRVGYVELWLQKHHLQAYQVGKYQE